MPESLPRAAVTLHCHSSVFTFTLSCQRWLCLHLRVPITLRWRGHPSPATENGLPVVNKEGPAKFTGPFSILVLPKWNNCKLCWTFAPIWNSLLFWILQQHVIMSALPPGTSPAIAILPSSSSQVESIFHHSFHVSSSLFSLVDHILTFNFNFLLIDELQVSRHSQDPLWVQTWSSTSIWAVPPACWQKSPTASTRRSYLSSFHILLSLAGLYIPTLPLETQGSYLPPVRGQECSPQRAVVGRKCRKPTDTMNVAPGFH